MVAGPVLNEERHKINSLTRLNRPQAKKLWYVFETSNTKTNTTKQIFFLKSKKKVERERETEKLLNRERESEREKERERKGENRNQH